MSLPFDPIQTYTLVPAMDAELPSEYQRRFTFRHLSLRQWNEAGPAFAALEQASEPADVTARALDILRAVMVDWTKVAIDNAEVSFAAERIDEVLTPRDVVAFAVKAGLYNGLGVEEIKKFESRSASATATLAATAPDPAGAPTDPASAPPW
jgi:hypothetical protein